MNQKRRVPGEKKRLVQAVEDIDNKIFISDRVNIRTWELTIDEYPLQQNNQTYLVSDGSSKRETLERDI